jgi:hypothetical protein
MFEEAVLIVIHICSLLLIQKSIICDTVIMCISPLQLMLLRTKLDEIWKENEGMEVLFLWTQFLKEEALKFLKVVTFTFSVN